MPEDTPRTLNHFALYAFKDSYWQLTAEERGEFHQAWLATLRAVSQTIHVYQVFPSESDADILVWAAVSAEGECDTAQFFEAYARATNPHRGLIRPTVALWGYTRPSQYTKTRSAQEMDPFAEHRKSYLIIYPFVKTAEWYLMSREARQGMMNEHIKIGKQHPEISQLLLYSVGVQDQEFVVVYETDDLPQFSDLVNELRGTQGRAYTLRDTPVHTAIYHPAEETLELWG